MRDEIIIQRDAVSLDICNSVLELNAGEQASIRDGLDTSVRKSRVTFLHGYLRYPKIWDALGRLIHQVNNDLYQFDLVQLETIQLTEYDSSYQGKYDAHVDVRGPSPETGFHRKLSVVVQMSPGYSYEGGDLIFPKEKGYDPQQAREQGTAIIFPSYLEHAVTPVTKGHRKSLVSWVEGPAFR